MKLPTKNGNSSDEKMNLPNKITISRIVLSILILIILIIPWYQVGIEFPKYVIQGKVIIDLKYIIVGVLFLIAALSDFVDGYLARKNNQVTDFGKTFDAIADKILVNGVLIVIAYNGFISIAIPVIIITRDIIVDALKMMAENKGITVAASNLGKIKTIFMLSGVTLMLFYNLPFELWNIYVADILIIVATVLSVVSAVNYYFDINNKINSKTEK